MRRMREAIQAEHEAIAARNAPIDLGELERICETLAAMSDRHLMGETSRNITFRFAHLSKALPVRVLLDEHLKRHPQDNTATQAVFVVVVGENTAFTVSESMTVTVFCSEIKQCRDGVARGVGTLRHPQDFAVLYGQGSLK